MGYKPSSDIYELVFKEHPGLEVVVKGASLGKLMDISAMDVKMNAQDQAQTMKIFKFLSKRIITWNVEHPDIDEDDSDEPVTALELLDGKSEACPHCGIEPGAPMPTTVEALKCLDLRFIMQIFFGWMQAVAQLPVPKDLNSPLGEKSTDTLMKQLGELQNPQKLSEPNLS